MKETNTSVIQAIESAKMMESWLHFGYESKTAACVICGKQPARIEPRYNYSICFEHFQLSPIDIQERTK